MKMAEKSVIMTLQNNTSINSNCVEVTDQYDGKITNGDTTIIKENDEINKFEDEPSTNTSILDDINNTTQDGADFLAGQGKQFHTDDDDGDGDEIVLGDNAEVINFKTDNNIVDCNNVEQGKDFIEETSDVKENLNSTDIETKDILLETIVSDDNVHPDMTKQLMDNDNESEAVESSCGDTDKTASTILTNTDQITEEENCIITEQNEITIEDEKQEETIPQNGEKNDENIKADSYTIQIPEENSNTNSSEESQTNKRKKSNALESVTKRLRLEIQENFLMRDKILNEFIELADCNSFEQLQIQTEQILTEIRTLNEMAKEKEREWNNILHLKKMKEELLLRLQRRKQIILLKKDNSDNNILVESQDDLLRNNIVQNQSLLKSSNSKKNINRSRNNNISSKSSPLQTDINGDNKQNKQRPILDVQSIIADYRQRHPETVPRRGRRIRSSQNDKISNNVINFTSLALGAGSQVHHNQNIDMDTELGILLNTVDANRIERSSSPSEDSPQNSEPSFKDMLVQFAKLSQSERNELIQNAIKPPPPYPEVTVHPVSTCTPTAPTNSLLHGILTKSTSSKANTKSSFSPTLARLLTAPERSNGHSPSSNLSTNNLIYPPNMSINEILSSSKARNEITITPVTSQFDNTNKTKPANQIMEDYEAEDSADRLVIDENLDAAERTKGDNSSDGGDEVPQCQGCNQKSALFVCAGCGNQWYCSRECQVSAWDEHSEVCSG